MRRRKLKLRDTWKKATCLGDMMSMMKGWMDGWGWENLDELVEGLVDENEWDEDGEDFLSKAGDESDQEAAFHGYDDDHDDYQPHADPDTAHDVLNVLALAELVQDGRWRWRKVSSMQIPFRRQMFYSYYIRCKKLLQTRAVVQRSRWPGQVVRQWGRR